MKPSWDEAPEWANYLAMDKNGQWFWFMEEPYDTSSFWMSTSAKGFEGVQQKDWNTTLEKRPANMSDIENDIAAISTHFRITPEDIEANIAREDYFTAAEGIFGHARMTDDNSVEITSEHMRLIFCVLTLRNGYIVTGESSCVSLKNFNDELGRRIARENATDKMWPLMGYALKSKLKNDAAKG